MIFVDTVHQRVLTLANKEQGGYITPLEFNLMANQAQMAIFEQYFYDLNQFKRDQASDTSSLSDIPEMIKMKLQVFSGFGNPNAADDWYQVGKIFTGTITDPETVREARKVDDNEAQFYLSSRFHRKGLRLHPIYVERGGNFTVFNHNGATTNFTAEVVRRPRKVEWGYNVVGEKALYNASSSTNFEIHESEENNIVMRILALAGVIMDKPGLVNVATQDDIKDIQQQKS